MRNFFEAHIKFTIALQCIFIENISFVKMVGFRSAGHMFQNITRLVLKPILCGGKFLRHEDFANFATVKHTHKSIIVNLLPTISWIHAWSDLYSSITGLSGAVLT